MKKILLDMDTGVDDALAIALTAAAEKAGDAQLIGITTCFGNVENTTAVRNSLSILSALGRTDVPVFPGSDRALAAKEKYTQPTIIFDMGTATTGFVLDRDANFIGGIITTGLKTSINALTAGAALLPQIDISAPKKVIGTNSIECMKSGCVIGTACMLDGLIDKFEEELGEKATVIVTGGLGQAIAEQCSHDMIIDKNLLIDGLKIIYNKNIDTRR